jgi:hypothetical protein
MQQAELESKEAMASLYIASKYMENQTTTIDDSTVVDWNNMDNCSSFRDALRSCSGKEVREQQWLAQQKIL